jgi:hypothetical protein
VRGGGLFVGVSRGKMSEGVDYSIVFVFGIPYASFKAAEVELKMKYNDEVRKRTGGGDTGREWYDMRAVRAIAHCIGRCVRHERDHGAITLMDWRIDQNMSKLPPWMRRNVIKEVSVDQAVQRLKMFYAGMRAVVGSEARPPHLRETDQTYEQNSKTEIRPPPGREVKIAPWRETQAPYGEAPRTEYGHEVKIEYGRDIKTPYGHEVKPEYGRDTRVPCAHEVKTEYGRDIRALYGHEVQTEHASETKTWHRQEDHGRTIRAQHGSEGEDYVLDITAPPGRAAKTEYGAKPDLVGTSLFCSGCGAPVIDVRDLTRIKFENVSKKGFLEIAGVVTANAIFCLTVVPDDVLIVHSEVGETVWSGEDGCAYGRVACACGRIPRLTVVASPAGERNVDRFPGREDGTGGGRLGTARVGRPKTGNPLWHPAHRRARYLNSDVCGS